MREIFKIEATYSPDDGGHYALVYDSSGKDRHETDLYPTRDDAIGAAREWINATRNATA
jgi:hypothetical protein